jgi:hypothetical protein
MKNYALIDENNMVINVSVANDNWSAEGWIPCADICGIGYTYNKNANVFIEPKPTCGHSELTLNISTYRWECDNAEHKIKL